ncbi:MAG: capsid cement protein [Gammaproteobacteria bacterium]
MANNYVTEGDVLNWTNNTGSAVASGAVVVVGSNGDAFIGIAQHDIGIGESGSVGIEGIWDVPKTDAAVIAAGEYVMWDASAGAFDDNQAVPAAGDVSDGAWAVESKDATVGATIRVKLTGKPGVLA